LQIISFFDVNAALISQVINGPKDFTTEQVCELSKFWGLTALESEFFILLIQRDRAGTQNLKKFFSEKIETCRLQSAQIQKRVEIDHILSDEAKAIFYSSWAYSAARLLTEIPSFQSLDEISARLNLSRQKTAKILEFLVFNGLCERRDDKYILGPQRTHLEYGSPFLGRHHMNWRAQALQKTEAIREDDELMFTAPLTLSRRDVLALRERLLQVIGELSAVVKVSKSETLYCLNVDLFEV